jgi:hypothetical protein
MTMVADMVSIDVEPGGRTVAMANLGVAEFIGLEPASTFQFRAISPHYRGDLSRFDGSQSMRDALVLLDAFVGDRPVSFFHAIYDAPKLRKLYALAGLACPKWPYFCAAQLTRHLTPHDQRRAGLLDYVVALDLFEPSEVQRRREVFKAHGGNKWLLHNAADDALATGLLVAHWSRTEALPYDKLLRESRVIVRCLADGDPVNLRA